METTSAAQPNGLATASMVLGIIAVVLSIIPVIGMISWAPASLAVILGVISLRKTPKGAAITGIVTGGVALVIFILWLVAFGAVMSKATAPGTGEAMDGIRNQVAEDAVAQYNIAARQGDKIQTCVQAGLAAAAYLQAKDEPQYNEWKARQASDCSRAGLPAQ